MSVPYLVHNASGRILRSGRCPASAVALQAGPGEVALAAEGRSDTHRVVNGRVVAAALPDARPLDTPARVMLRARRYLAATDWMVVRAAETGAPVPEDVRARRAEARETISRLRAARD